MRGALRLVTFPEVTPPMSTNLALRLAAGALILFAATLTGCAPTQPAELSTLPISHSAQPFETLPSGYSDAAEAPRHQSRPHGELVAVSSTAAVY